MPAASLRHKPALPISYKGDDEDEKKSAIAEHQPHLHHTTLLFARVKAAKRISVKQSKQAPHNPSFHKKTGLCSWMSIYDNILNRALPQ